MTNVDSVELAKFASRAQEWWDAKGPFRTLHEINALRLDYLAARAELAGAKVLDVGCGGGLLAEGLVARGATVLAIHLAERNIDIAREHAARGALPIDYRCASAETIAEEMPGRFDVINLPRDAKTDTFRGLATTTNLLAESTFGNPDT